MATLPNVPSLLTVKLLTGLALAVFHSAFPLVVTTRFGLDAKGSGYVMSYSGVLGMFAQAVVVQWATARYDDKRIIVACIAGLTLSFLGLMAASTTLHLCLIMVPFAVFGALLSTVNTAQLTKAAPTDMGTIVSLDMSVGSGVRVVSPTARDAPFYDAYLLGAHGAAAGVRGKYALVMMASCPLAFLPVLRRWRRWRSRGLGTPPLEGSASSSWLSLCALASPPSTSCHEKTRDGGWLASFTDTRFGRAVSSGTDGAAEYD